MLKKFFFLFIALSSFSQFSYSDYNANKTGEVTEVLTYVNGLILIRLNNQPSSHLACKATYFAIPTDTPEAIANRLVSRALTAYSTKTQVNIGYDIHGDCANGYIRIHRIG